jgi:hypothetical protein
MADQPAHSAVKTAIQRAVVLAGILFALILGVLTASAWFSSDDDRNLPFGYEGFDQRH